MVADCRMTFSCILTRTAKGYSLIDNNIVTDFRSFTDNNAGAVVDKKSFTDFCSGMDFYTGFSCGTLRNVSGKKVKLFVIKLICKPVCPDSLQARIEKEYFYRRAGSRVSSFKVMVVARKEVTPCAA